MTATAIQISHVTVGRLGEAFVADNLRYAGLEVQPGQRADLRALVDGRAIEIEVKTARPSNYDGRGTLGYQFTLYKTHYGRRVKTDARRADVIVLICLDHAATEVRAVYILPARTCDTRRTISLPLSLNSTHFDVYRDAWNIIADIN